MLHPGAAVFITTGGDNSVWLLGGKLAKEGYEIFKLNRGTGEFEKQKGRARRLAIDEKGFPWIIDSKMSIIHQNEKGWENHKAKGTQITIGHDGSIFGLDGKRDKEGYGVWKFDH